jgi:glutamate synthase domain-containing protein 3
MQYEMVELETLEDEDSVKLRRLVRNHSMYTDSPLAKKRFWQIKPKQTFCQSKADRLQNSITKIGRRTEKLKNQ